MAASKTYLVPVDFSKASESALNYAIRLAREDKMKLQLLHAIPPPPALSMADEAGQFIQDYYDFSEKDGLKRLKKLVQSKKLGSAGRPVLIVKRGDPARVIVDQAKKSRAAMIIMGSHGRSGLKRLMLGSVAERTLRYAECPVLVVK